MFTELFPGLALEDREALAGLRSLVGELEFLSFRGLLSLSLGGQGSETNEKLIALELLIAGKPVDFR